ncbi:hypothetical protein V6N13_022890 [Hibiscus sabdariffa]
MEQVGEQHGDKQQVGKQQAGNQQAGEKQQQDGEQRIGVRVQQTGEQVQGRENQSVSVFVENIPKAMHWKGLWHAFARHGDVTDTFIPRKLSRGGKRFGFVRLKSRTDALRIIERLNGFILYGYRLTVKMARFKKGVYKEKSSETQGTKNWMNDTVGRVKTVMESGNQNRGKLKRISGHVMEEELWKLRRCLVGEMASICSLRSIVLRLQEWGLGEIRVQRMGSKLFLLSFEDDELYMMLEDLNWSYLREIFMEVRPWSETLKQPERATWLEVSGCPLHCWNHTTLKRVAELWGTFEAVGENINHRKDCEKVSVLISTSQAKRIEEVIEIEIGSMIVEVGVKELGFSDISTEGVMAKVVPVKKDNDVQDSGSTLGYSSEAEKNDSSEAGRSGSRVEDEALNEMCADKRFNNCQAQGSERTSCQLGEFELIGGGFKVGSEVASDIQEKQCGAAENVEGVDCIKLCDTDAKGDNWAGTGCEGPDGTKEIMGAKKDDQKVEGHDMVSSRALEDVGNIGLNGVNTEKGSWAKALEDKMNIGVAWNRGNYLDSSGNQNQSEEGRDNIFFPELEK